LFDGDPEVYVDTKAAVGMINPQFGAITSPADMGAMRLMGKNGRHFCLRF